MTGSPPLRFLMLALALWIGARTAWIGWDWLVEEPRTQAAAPSSMAFEEANVPALSATPALPSPSLGQVPGAGQAGAFRGPLADGGVAQRAGAAWTGDAHRLAGQVRSSLSLPVFEPGPPPRPAVAGTIPGTLASAPGVAGAPSGAGPLGEPPAPLLPASRAGAARGAPWSASAWIFARRSQVPALAPGGLLGGSQAGGRIAYRMAGSPSRPLSASLRAAAALDGLQAAEAGLGLDWKPIGKVPVHLLVERRQALGKAGRSAFSAMVHGGVSDLAAGALRIDGYGQAGMVGLRSRDLFADGSARVGLPVGPVKIGAGLWAAAQPGAERLDLGPQASVRLPGKAALALDWRFRVAGGAAPESGPTLTLSTDF